MAGDRLTPLDSSFLRIETASAHMHVGWRGTFRPDPARPPVTATAVRELVAGRLGHADRFRQRVVFPPAGLGEPVWIDDERFDLRYHVRQMSGPGEMLTRGRFAEIADDFLSRRLDRDRPLWQIGIVPHLRDGTVGMVMKIHHAMVDGKSAVALALLLLDADPDQPVPAAPDEWSPSARPTGARLALDALRETGEESLRMAAGLARAAGSPTRGVRLAETLRRAAFSAGEDLLRPAPSSFLNGPIGPQRRLLAHAAPMRELLHIKELSGATLNDVALAVVAGALRRMALARDTLPLPLKVMVPVSMREAAESGALGNRISFVFITLPVHVDDPMARLRAVGEATRRFKDVGRAAGGSTVMGALGHLPEPIKQGAARIAASPRMYNLTVSNIPGPRTPAYLLGAPLVDAFPVVPLSDGHALSIGMFSYVDRMFFGVHAAPDALPDAGRLPGALNGARIELRRAAIAQNEPPSDSKTPSEHEAWGAAS